MKTNIGDRRRTKKFAFLPVTLSNGQKVFLKRYYVIEEWQQWERWPLGVPDPDCLDQLAAYCRDIEQSYRFQTYAAEIRAGIVGLDEGWRTIEVAS